MKKFSLLLAAAVLFSYTGFSQSAKNKDKTSDTAEGAEYIPVEGHSETGVPKELQGTWVLTSGIKKSKPEVDVKNVKPSPGTETRRDSKTTTTTVDGETRTVTEVEVDRIATPEKQITPAQKNSVHKAEKPSISFYGLNETFSGFTGCNKYSGRYSISGNKITLRNASASTRMVCLGEYDEKTFLSTLNRVNSFRNNSGQLELMDGSDVLLVFSRK